LQDYDKLIREEAQHFARYLMERQSQGTSLYVDWRWGERIITENPHIEDDPGLARILDGEYRDRIINEASGSSMRVLELGSGGGWLSLELARRGTHAHAIELSFDQILIAKNHLNLKSYNGDFGSVNYICTDLNTICLPEKYYDRVVVFNVFHHLHDLYHVLKEVRKTIKQDGKLVIYDYIGPDSFSKLIERVLAIVLPSSLTPYKGFKGKLAAIAKKLKLLPPDYQKHLRYTTGSPFEGVVQKEMVNLVRSLFDIDMIETNLAFYASVAVRLKDTAYKYKITRILKKIDDSLIKLGISRGRYVFIIAHSKE
jgi:2-polyprenyl-3-methyl-5-hydroxy-6-metoxy-1,4-benzoquinol methylase